MSVDVKNSGDKDYEDVIQMYLVPEDTKDFLPFYALKSFQRVPLNKGETKKLTFNLTEEDLKQTNLEGEKTWIKGNYKLLISNALPSHRSANLEPQNQQK